MGFYELSDINLSKITMIVPKKFQKRSRSSKALKICKRDLSKEDVKQFKGLPATTPLRTLIDIYEKKPLPENIME